MLVHITSYPVVAVCYAFTGLIDTVENAVNRVVVISMPSNAVTHSHSDCRSTSASGSQSEHDVLIMHGQFA